LFKEADSSEMPIAQQCSCCVRGREGGRKQESKMIALIAGKLQWMGD
jgi:hypothetical protein